MTRHAVRISRDLYEDARQVARERGTTITAVINLWARVGKEFSTASHGENVAAPGDGPRPQ